jgi:hypothetical protein
MDLTDYLIFFIIAWVVIKVGQGIIEALMLANIQERVSVLKHLNDIIHQVKIEKHGEMEYWFDEHNDTFLGQGKTLDEITNHIKSRFPNHVFIIQGKGGIAAQTDWKLLAPEEFKKIEFKGEL